MHNLSKDINPNDHCTLLILPSITNAAEGYLLSLRDIKIFIALFGSSDDGYMPEKPQTRAKMIALKSYLHKNYQNGDQVRMRIAETITKEAYEASL